MVQESLNPEPLNNEISSTEGLDNLTTIFTFFDKKVSARPPARNGAEIEEEKKEGEGFHS
jgi:hypothetical protein